VPGSAFHLKRPAEGLDAVGKHSKSRPSGRICPTHAIVGDLAPDPAATNRHGNGNAGGGGVLGHVGEGLGADEVGGCRDALGQLGPGDLEFDRKQEVSCQGGQRALQPMLGQLPRVQPWASRRSSSSVRTSCCWAPTIWSLVCWLVAVCWPRRRVTASFPS
jgi:hypothetical protein